MTAATRRVHLDGSTPATSAILAAVRPGHAPRHVVLLEVHPGWTSHTGGRPVLVAEVRLETLAAIVSVTELGEDRALEVPTLPGVALVLVDIDDARGNVAIVVPAGAVDHDAVHPTLDAVLAGDTLLAQLVAMATGPYGRLVLALAETEAADRRRRERAVHPTTEQAVIAELQRELHETRLARQAEAARADRAEQRSRQLARELQMRGSTPIARVA